jgi:ATP-dependent Clp protease adaptor protein ClpS
MPEIEVIETLEESIKIKIPKMYKVLLHNDDTTTADFVIAVLMSIFHKTLQDAMLITQEVHEKGIGIAGLPYTFEVALEKVIETTNFARINNFPLMSSSEEI